MGVKELMPVLAVTRIGKFYRTTIPREVRKLLELNEGDEIEWIFEDNRVILKKKGENTLNT